MSSRLRQIGEAINDQEFDHCFTLHSDGTITDVPGVYAPNVYNDDANDIYIDGPEWSAITGMTGQDSYHGAVMHSSEYIGSDIARSMLDMVVDGPMVFAIVVVEVLSDDPNASENEEPAGWAIVYRDQRVSV